MSPGPTTTCSVSRRVSFRPHGWPSFRHGAPELQDRTTPSRPALTSLTGRVTTNVTAKDIEAGQVRIPIGARKRLLPSDRGEVEVVLGGRHMTCRWDPRSGADRERLGLIRLGRAAATELRTPGDLQVAVVDSVVHLDMAERRAPGSGMS